MELTQTDLNDLAAFFGRRLDVTLTPTPAPRSVAEERQREMAWLLALEEAQDAGKLSALLLKISRRFPDDPTLQEATALLMDPGRGSDRAAGLVFLAAGAVGALGLLVVGIGTAGALLSGSVTLPTASPSLATIAPAMEVVGSAESEAPNRRELAVPTGRCTRPDGGPVGYWYAGSGSPGTAGSVVQLDRAVNVRVDYPGKHNRFFKNAHIECVLQPGDRVKLSSDPIHVPGGAWWVPLHTGDLQAPPRTARAESPAEHAG